MVDRASKPFNECVDAAGAMRILGVKSRTTVTNTGMPVVGTANGGNVYWIPDVQTAANERQGRRTSRGA